MTRDLSNPTPQFLASAPAGSLKPHLVAVVACALCACSDARQSNTSDAATPPLCEASVVVRLADGAAYPERLVSPRLEAGEPVATDAGAALLLTRELTGRSILIGDAAVPLFFGQNVQWRAFRRGRDTCDAINGADFVAVSAGSRLVVVGQRSIDEPDRVIDGELQLRAASGGTPTLPFAGSWHLVSAADGVALADLVFTTDADGERSLWLTAPDGSTWALAPGHAGTPPSGFSGAPCDACELVDQVVPGACD